MTSLCGDTLIIHIKANSRRKVETERIGMCVHCSMYVHFVMDEEDRGVREEKTCPHVQISIILVLLPTAFFSLYMDEFQQKIAFKFVDAKEVISSVIVLIGNLYLLENSWYRQLVHDSLLRACFFFPLFCGINRNLILFIASLRYNDSLIHF